MNILERIDRALASYRDRTALREELCRIRESVLVEEQKSRAQRELLEAVVNTLPFAILLIDDLGKIVFTNSEAQALFFEGRSPEGQNFLQLLGAVHEGLRQALLSETDHIFSFGGQGDGERYHLARRHFELGGEPHSMLIVRNLTTELSRQENAVLRKAIRVIHHEFANSLTPVRARRWDGPSGAPSSSKCWA